MRQILPAGQTWRIGIVGILALLLVAVAHAQEPQPTPVYQWGAYGSPTTSWAINHVSSTTHVAGTVQLVNQAGTRATFTGTALDVNCTGCSSASVVSVSHVTSTTHVAGTVQITAQDGTRVTLTGTSINVNCTGGCGTAAEGQTYAAALEASAAAASKDHLNLFNASGSGKVLKVRAITINPDLAATVTGLVQSFDIVRVTSAGATCTSVTIRLVDSTNASVPAQVTASTNCSTDPTVDFFLLGFAQDGEEARSSTSWYGNAYTFRSNGGQPITLREGQGITIRSSALSGAWPVSLSVEFTM